MEYYYSRDGGEMKPGPYVSSGGNYDGEVDQRRDNRRRSVQNVVVLVLAKFHCV